MPLCNLLSYPATYTGARKFTPSLLFSLDDILLPTKFLKGAIGAYAGNVAEKNPRCKAHELDLMSPLAASEEQLKLLPPTLVQVSENDPLRDYGILFAVKLAKAGGSVQLQEHENLPHGVLNMNSPIFELRRESNQMIWQCLDYINSAPLFSPATDDRLHEMID